MSIVVVIVLCVCIIWASYQITGFPKGAMVGLLFTLQTVVLAIMGSAQVASSISQRTGLGNPRFSPSVTNLTGRAHAGFLRRRPDPRICFIRMYSPVLVAGSWRRALSASAG